MATYAQEQRTSQSNGAENWAARVFLQPIAAPSVLGLYGFAGATFIVAAHMAGWYGSDRSALYLFPFAGMLGALLEGNLGVGAVLATLGAGSAFAAIAFLTGGSGWEKLAGWVFVAS